MSFSNFLKAVLIFFLVVMPLVVAILTAHYYLVDKPKQIKEYCLNHSSTNFTWNSGYFEIEDGYCCQYPKWGGEANCQLIYSQERGK